MSTIQGADLAPPAARSPSRPIPRPKPDDSPGSAIAAPLLSILVPCLDEEDNVTITLDQLGKVLENAAIEDFEIVVLDDASSDQTFERSVTYGKERPELHIRTERRRAPRRGYGAIVRHGIAHARGTWVIPVSGDGVDPVELIPAMLTRAVAGADLVQCSRYHRQEGASTIPFSYRFYQFWWRTLIRIGTGERLPDSTYAFKLFRRVDALSRGITSNGFSIADPDDAGMLDVVGFDTATPGVLAEFIH